MAGKDPATPSSARACGRAFWEGLTRPHGAAAVGMLALTALGWIFLSASSTEARVRATDTGRWMRSATEGWFHLNAVSIQGAARHARGPGQTVVLIGPSFLQELLPPGDRLTAGFAPADPAAPPVRVVALDASALSLEETAAVVDKFGGDFDGWFVVHVNRHTMARDLEARDDRKKQGGLLVGFYSKVLADERALSGMPVTRQWGIPLLDFPSFYLPSLGGWRRVLFPWSSRFWSRLPSKPAPRRAPAPAEITATLPLSASGAQAHNFELLGRIAERLRAGGRARLAIVEVPFADEVTPQVQTAAWHTARAKFVAQREAWSRTHGVPWLDVTDELALQPGDFIDAMHVRSPAVSARFAAAVSRWLPEAKP